MEIQIEHENDIRIEPKEPINTCNPCITSLYIGCNLIAHVYSVLRDFKTQKSTSDRRAISIFFLYRMFNTLNRSKVHSTLGLKSTYIYTSLEIQSYILQNLIICLVWQLPINAIKLHSNGGSSCKQSTNNGELICHLPHQFGNKQS